jgi:hypothetical protein
MLTLKHVGSNFRTLAIAEAVQLLGHRLDDRNLVPGNGRDSLFATASRAARLPTEPPSYSVATGGGGYFFDYKAARLEDNHSSPGTEPYLFPNGVVPD